MHNRYLESIEDVDFQFVKKLQSFIKEKDAIHIDTDRLNANAVFDAVMAHIHTHMGADD